MKIITIISLILVILCQFEFIYIINSMCGSTDLLARILVALHKHDIDLDGVEIKAIEEDDKDEKEDN